MAWLDIKWQLNAWGFEESRGDEQGLQFAIVVTNPEKEWIGVTGYQTGNMNDLDRQLFGGRIKVPAEYAGTDRGWVGIPDATKPYFAVVARALEFDSSSDKNRRADYGAFVQAVREGCRASAAAGELPTEAQLLAWGRSAQISDRIWKDDDDNIGTAVVLWPDFGSPVSEQFYDVTTPGLTHLGFAGRFESNRLRGDGAIWDLTIGATVLTGETDDPIYNTQERGGWWFFGP